MSTGIDYGRYPMADGTLPNRDPETGIRYGIIPVHALAHWAVGEFEAEYDASCPECGADKTDPDDGESCACGFAPEDSGDWYREEPSRWVYRQNGYALTLDESGEVWIFKAPHTTRAGFCSPCAPGACYLTDCAPDGAQAYCMGADWFDADAPMPYKID